MTAEELRRAAIALFGERGWMSRLAEALGVDRSSVSRWFAGLPVPGPAASAVTAWLEIARLTKCEPGAFQAPGSPDPLPSADGRIRQERASSSQLRGGSRLANGEPD